MVVKKKNNLPFQRQALYILKRHYGVEVDLYKISSDTYDLETGESTKSWNKYTIRKAIVLRGKDVRDFIYDLSFIASNRNFTYGGFFDVDTRYVIIDKKDISQDESVEITQNDHLQFNGKRWEILEVLGYEENSQIYKLRVKAVAGASLV